LKFLCCFGYEDGQSLSVPQSCLLCLKMVACKVVLCNFLVIKINIIFLLQYLTEDLYVLIPQPMLVSTNSQTETLSQENVSGAPAFSHTPLLRWFKSINKNKVYEKINQTCEWVQAAMNYVHAKFHIQHKNCAWRIKKTNPYMNICGFCGSWWIVHPTW
jgi:hypothetical protein